MEAVRVASVRHDMTQGFVLTQYFYEQLLQFEKDPASLRDSIGEMVYGMDIDQQVHRARQTDFDKQADADVLERSKPRKLEGLDLAEAKLAAGDVSGASQLARQALSPQEDSLAAVASNARANFILARVAVMTGHPEDAINRFQTTLATSKEPRLRAWSHIYLGRMLDLECKRDQAVSEYRLALETRDGQQDTRLAAERGIKSAYAVNGHACEEDDADDEPGSKPTQPGPAAKSPPSKPQ
jgi:tetratricopeptide (TPR) repeat protein